MSDIDSAPPEQGPFEVWIQEVRASIAVFLDYYPVKQHAPKVALFLSVVYLLMGTVIPALWAGLCALRKMLPTYKGFKTIVGRVYSAVRRAFIWAFTGNHIAIGVIVASIILTIEGIPEIYLSVLVMVLTALLCIQHTWHSYDKYKAVFTLVVSWVFGNALLSFVVHAIYWEGDATATASFFVGVPFDMAIRHFVSDEFNFQAMLFAFFKKWWADKQLRTLLVVQDIPLMPKIMRLSLIPLAMMGLVPVVDHDRWNFIYTLTNDVVKKFWYLTPVDSSPVEPRYNTVPEDSTLKVRYAYWDPYNIYAIVSTIAWASGGVVFGVVTHGVHMLYRAVVSHIRQVKNNMPFPDTMFYRALFASLGGNALKILLSTSFTVHAMLDAPSDKYASTDVLIRYAITVFVMVMGLYVGDARKHIIPMELWSRLRRQSLRVEAGDIDFLERRA
jgi:hypothetical protein